MIHGTMLAAGRAVVGLVLVAFLPGYLWTRLIWDDVDWAVQGFAAIVLSLSMVSLLVFALNLWLAVPITLTTTLLVVAFLCAMPVALLGRDRIAEAMGAFEEE